MDTPNPLWASLMGLPTPWEAVVHFYGSTEVGRLTRDDEWSEVMFSAESLPPVPVAGIECDEGQEILPGDDRFVSTPPPTNRLVVAPVPHDWWCRETVPHPIEQIIVRFGPTSTIESYLNGLRGDPPEDVRYYPMWDVRRGGWEVSGDVD